MVKSQFDFKEVPEFITIKDFYISKRKKRTLQREGRPRIDIGLPEFSKFTELVIYHFKQCMSDRLFRIGRIRAHQIVKHKTGLWCHYFRSQKISYLVNKTKSALITARLVGIKSASTISHYYKTEWREHKEDLKI